MAELMICIQDRANEAERVKSNQLYQRGDVIVIVPDGHPWSEIERTKADWRIVSIPGVDPEALTSLVTPEQPTRVDWQKRLVRLDLDSLVWSADERRAFDAGRARSGAITVVETKVRDATVQRARIAGGVIEVR
jgi:hypothetical protein